MSLVYIKIMEDKFLRYVEIIFCVCLAILFLISCFHTA
jgi:hypothetical protein